MSPSHLKHNYMVVLGKQPFFEQLIELGVYWVVIVLTHRVFVSSRDSFWRQVGLLSFWYIALAALVGNIALETTSAGEVMDVSPGFWGFWDSPHASWFRLTWAQHPWYAHVGNLWFVFTNAFTSTVLIKMDAPMATLGTYAFASGAIAHCIQWLGFHVEALELGKLGSTTASEFLILFLTNGLGTLFSWMPVLVLAFREFDRKKTGSYFMMFCAIAQSVLFVVHESGLFAAYPDIPFASSGPHAFATRAYHGWFFAEHATMHALYFIAPLICWINQSPVGKKLQ